MAPVQVSGDTVADHLVNQLLALGVRRIYGIVGDSLNPIVDAVRRSNKDGKGIQWIHVRHEESAAFAAGAEAEATGKLAVCAGSCGPGNLHLINGLYDANRNRVPVLAIASHIPSVQIGTHYFQETHPDRIFNECSVYNEMVTNPAQFPRVFASAVQHAWAGPGVSVITLPGDTSASSIETTYPIEIVQPEAPIVTPPRSRSRNWPMRSTLPRR
jgi:pyruvate dehydrogenase (cytochrome) (EC 1.2.2.2)